jgi:hypothetical protein
MSSAQVSPEQRFARKWVLDPVTGCHMWTAGLTSDGYGKNRAELHRMPHSAGSH